MPSKAFKLAEAMVSNPVMSDMVENPTATPTQIAAVETKTSAISDTGIISVNTKNIVSNNVFTQSFDSNQVVGFNLTDSINTVSPIVSVFKEIPVSGVSSKGQWDVNANATNYDFYDEKPISYSSSTLTPSATGDGTFTSSNPTETSYDFSNPTAGATSTFTAPSWNVLAFSTDGLKLIAFDNGYLKLKSYNLSTAWDISTISSSANAESSISTGDLYGATISADGTKLIGYVNANGYVYEYTMSTPFDVTTLTADGNTNSLGGVSTSNAFNWFIKPGTYDTVYAVINRHLYKYTFTGGSITTGTVTRDANFLDLDPGNTKSYTNNGQLQFKPDGTEFYIGQGTDSIIEKWTLSTPWDITTGSKSSDTASYTTVGNIWLKPDGKRMYYIDNADSKKVKEIITGSTLAFNSSDVGKKVVGNSGSAIITSTAGAYKSVTAFADTSTISSWQLFSAEGKANGSGITLSGFSNAYNLNLASYDNKNYATSLTSASGVAFSSDGTKMYLNGFNTAADQSTNQHIWQYSLSTAWDVTTASYDNISLNTSAQNTRQRDLRFKPDGTVLYMVGSTPDGVWQYDLSTAWDLSTASYSNKTISVGSQDTNPAALALSPDGTKVYVAGYSSKIIFQYDLSTAWDLSNSTYWGWNYNRTTSGEVYSTSSINSMEINSSGTKLYVSVAAAPSDVIIEYDLPSNGKISDITYSDSYDQWTTLGGADLKGIAFSSSGDKFYTFGTNDYKVYEFSVGSTSLPYSQYSPALTNSSNGQINSSSWIDINSMTADETKNGGDIFYAVSTDNRNSWGVANASDGVRKIARNNSGTWQYNNDAGGVSGYGLANETYDNKNLDTTSGTLEETETGIAVSSDGTKFYITGYGQGKVFQFDLSTPFDLSTGAYNNVSYTLTGLTYPWGLIFKPDGTRMYVLDPQSTATISEYALSTAWDVSTASHTATGNYPAGPLLESYGLFFKSDGSKVYILRYDSTVYSWNLTTPWDITTGSYIGVTSAFLNSNSGRDILFNNDGLKMYLHLYDGTANSYYVREYDLSTAWDPSTASYNNISFQPGLDLGGSSTTISAMCWANSGKKLYVTKSKSSGGSNYGANSFTTTTTGFGTSETWVNGTTNNEHATLQQALTSQAFNRMNKAQLDAIADAYHFSQDSADTLDLMIAPYAASGTSPISDGVTINYDAAALVREAIPGTDYIAEFPNNTTINIKSLVNTNMKVRAL